MTEAIDLDALDRQADTISAMIHLGEGIAWGADTGVIDQQRAAIADLRAQIDRLTAINAEQATTIARMMRKGAA